MVCEKKLTQRNNGETLINKYWVLLETCSTASVCCNPYLIDRIKCFHAQEIIDILQIEDHSSIKKLHN